MEIKELEELINWISKKDIVPKTLTKENRDTLYFNIENVEKDSTFFIKSKIDSINIKYKNKNDKYSNPFNFKIFQILNYILEKLNNMKLSKSEKKYWMQKFSGLSLEELNQKISKICSLLKLDIKEFKVKEIYPGCFCIEKV